MHRYEELVPAVEVLSGREAVAVFTQSKLVEVIDPNGELQKADEVFTY